MEKKDDAIGIYHSRYYCYEHCVIRPTRTVLSVLRRVKVSGDTFMVRQKEKCLVMVTIHMLVAVVVMQIHFNLDLFTGRRREARKICHYSPFQAQ